MFTKLLIATLILIGLNYLYKRFKMIRADVDDLMYAHNAGLKFTRREPNLKRVERDESRLGDWIKIQIINRRLRLSRRDLKK